ncbi:unnamed protein product [Ranitomeya imitator]|uniref:CCHC-type domain-containing protein n=1 Tax=Ranitomeya imitator TaxID=111125 RepID=A0ABN9MNC6_9NEOB|nr:unnamed protein product [Ranitomeya imitator]
MISQLIPDISEHNIIERVYRIKRPVSLPQEVPRDIIVSFFPAWIRGKLFNLSSEKNFLLSPYGHLTFFRDLSKDTLKKRRDFSSVTRELRRSHFAYSWSPSSTLMPTKPNPRFRAFKLDKIQAAEAPFSITPAHQAMFRGKSPHDALNPSVTLDVLSRRGALGLSDPGRDTCYIGLSCLLEALGRRGSTSVPLVDIWVIQDTDVVMDIKGLSSCVDHLTARVQNIQDFVVQNSMLEPRIPIPDLFSGDRAKFLSFKNNCKLFLALKPRSSGDPVQQVKIIISLLRGDPQDWAFSLAPGDPALCDIDAFFLALGLLYDEPNSVDQAEKKLMALCQGQDEVEIYCQKFRKWSVLTQWNECALAAIFRKGLSEALKDVMVGFPMPAGLNESMSLAIQIDRRLRERKTVHHLAVLSEHKPEPMQCDRTLTRAERQEHRRRNGLCFYCGDSTHAISDCPKRTKRFARSATIGTVQSKFLLSVTLICSLSSYSVMAFVDSGAALNLMDLEFARRCGFFLEPLQCPIPLRGIDATPLAKNKPQYWTQLTMCMAPAHQEDIRFLVLHNLHDVVVLGLPWLQVHNPVLDWKSMSVSSWGCQGVHGDVPFLSISSSTPSEVPEFLSDYRDVFDEPKSSALPPHRDCDCAIDLIPGSKFPKGRLFNLSVPEHAAMRSYVKESL